MPHADRGAVLVTGSSTGIGRARALHLDGLAFRVFAGVRREADAASLAADASDRLEPMIVPSPTRPRSARRPPTSRRRLRAGLPVSSTTPA